MVKIARSAKQEELKQCPFCGGGMVAIDFSITEKQVKCKTAGCRATTGPFLTVDAAIQSWNTRMPPSEGLPKTPILRKKKANSIGVNVCGVPPYLVCIDCGCHVDPDWSDKHVEWHKLALADEVKHGR